MSRKKSKEYLKYLQKQINLGKHPNYFAKLLKLKTVSILSLLRKNNLKCNYYKNTYTKYQTNKKFFKNINTEIEAYYLGFIMADGSITIKKNNYNFSISIQKKDRYILEKLSNAVLNKDKIRNIDKKQQVKLQFSCKNIITNLIRYGIIPNKTYKTNSFPLIKEELMPHFIRGYFDGDGSVYNKKQRYKIGSAVSFTGHYLFVTSLENYLKLKKIITTNVRTKQKLHQFDSVFEFEKKTRYSKSLLLYV